MRHFKRAACCAAGALAALASCVEVDNTLGGEYVPADHVMRIVRDSSFVVRTYNVTLDSLAVSGLGFGLLGGYKNPATGVSLDAGIVFQMQRPTKDYFTQSDSLYGTRPVIDSAVVRLGVYDAMGETQAGQLFDLYELDRRVWIDSVYYGDFDPTPFMASAPLASVAHSGEGAVEFRIEDRAFLQRLVDTTGYYMDSLFKERFRAFYITPRTAHADAAAYRIDMLGDARMTTYYHNDEYPDTVLSTTYSFAPYTPDRPYTYNQTVNVIRRDYSGVLPGLGLNDSLTPVPRIMVEGFGGMVARLEFTRESIEALKARVRAKGFSQIAVNQAVLQISYPARDADGRDHLPDRLGIYRDFPYREGIADYNWYAEYSYLLTNGTSTRLLYDGHIHPARYLYRMDVTTHVQQLFKSSEELAAVGQQPEPVSVYLAPSYETLHFGGGDNFTNPRTAVLSGSGSDSPPLLVITYTMIR